MAPSLHATALVVGEVGVLLRGPSGAGKTRLALALAADAAARGRFARLVADDRTLVEAAGGRLLARPHPAIAGLAECRGLGVTRVAHEPACVLGLVVDLVAGDPARMPEPASLRCEVAGVALPRLALPAAGPASDAVALIWASGALGGDAPAPAPIPLANPAAMHKIAPKPNGRAGSLPGRGMSGSFR